MSVILASGSSIRALMLRNAGVVVDVVVPRVDEAAIRDALLAEDAHPRDIADALAEAKARKVGMKHQSDWVLGCDQVLAIGGQIMEKPATVEAARTQLAQLRGQMHQLLSAVVIYQGGAPVWRHVGVARLTMRDFSDEYLESYLSRNWPEIGASVGAYQLESEGVRLFSSIVGDYFTILGLPLLEVLNYLSLRGVIDA